MSQQFDIDPVPPLPEHYDKDCVIPHACEAIARIHEENVKKEHAKHWNMKPVIDNFKKLIIQMVCEQLNEICKSNTVINMDHIIQQAFDMYITPNLDKHHINAIYMKYCDMGSTTYFRNRFFHNDLRHTLNEYLSPCGWQIEEDSYYKYSQNASNIRIRFTEEQLGLNTNTLQKSKKKSKSNAKPVSKKSSNVYYVNIKYKSGDESEDDSEDESEDDNY